jgi:hypothetical protein
MPVFMTRVELHDATPADYETLNAAMASQGFQRTIIGDDGQGFLLPTGNYLGQTDASASEVMNIAGFAASMTSRAFSLLATEFERTSWRGLRNAQATTAQPAPSSAPSAPPQIS